MSPIVLSETCRKEFRILQSLSDSSYSFNPLPSSLTNGISMLLNKMDIARKMIDSFFPFIIWLIDGWYKSLWSLEEELSDNSKIIPHTHYLRIPRDQQPRWNRSRSYPQRIHRIQWIRRIPPVPSSSSIPWKRSGSPRDQRVEINYFTGRIQITSWTISISKSQKVILWRRSFSSW